jgi:hypothetical protein
MKLTKLLSQLLLSPLARAMLIRRARLRKQLQLSWARSAANLSSRVEWPTQSLQMAAEKNKKYKTKIQNQNWIWDR